MAKIKGWNKIQDRKNSVAWKSSDGEIVRVVKPYKEIPSPWIMGADGMLHVKKFTTKNEAIESAMNYMRSYSGVSGFYKGMPIVSNPLKGYHKVEGASAIDPKYELYAKGSRFSGDRKSFVVPKKR